MNQNNLIEDLAKTNQDYINKFEKLKLGIEKQTSNLTAGDLSLDTEINSTLPQEVNYLNFNAYAYVTANRSETIKSILDTHAPSANDPRLTNLQHYFDLLTTMLDEVDEPKYQILLPSRSRVRVAIHDTFDQEMHFLAHPFGDDLSKRVRDHFATLVAASRNKWSLGTSDYFAPHIKTSWNARDASTSDNQSPRYIFRLDLPRIITDDGSVAHLWIWRSLEILT